jgi:hypothetical protein
MICIKITALNFLTMIGHILILKNPIIVDIIFSEMLIYPILRYGILWIDTVENQGGIGAK